VELALGEERLLERLLHIGRARNTRELLPDARAAVALVPSYYEGFGYAVAEARCAGLPFLAARASSLIEVAGGAGTLLDPDDQALVAGFVINKFRGDRSILAPGLDRMEELTGRPVLGVLPYVEDLWMDVEDSLALEAPRPEERSEGDTLDVAVIRLRWMSNFTDADALGVEPGVRVRFTRSAADIERADLVIVPGTKATVEDLERLHADGLARPLTARAAAGRPILGICGGYQLLGERIDDPIESQRGVVSGLGLLPVSTTFATQKLLRRRAGACPWLGTRATGYEIRHGRITRHGGQPWLRGEDGEPEGCREGAVLGASWHGLLENDELRRALLRHVADQQGRRLEPSRRSFAAVREARLDALGDLVADHLDTQRLTELIQGGPPGGLPSIRTEVRACCAS